MLTTFDLFHLARFLKRPIEEVVNDYIVPVDIFGVGYPFFTLKTKPHGDVCVFYKGGCSVQEAKPLPCRLYPLNIEPGPHDGLSYCLVSQKQHHYTGEAHRVAGWMAENLAPDDRRFMVDWFVRALEHGRLIRKIKANAESRDEFEPLMASVLWLMYFCYKPQDGFWPQYERNMALLDKLLNTHAGG
jgi:Fe-S-cluster containining protein